MANKLVMLALLPVMALGLLVAAPAEQADASAYRTCYPSDFETHWYHRFSMRMDCETRSGTMRQTTLWVYDTAVDPNGVISRNENQGWPGVWTRSCEVLHNAGRGDSDGGYWEFNYRCKNIQGGWHHGLFRIYATNVDGHLQRGAISSGGSTWRFPNT